MKKPRKPWRLLGFRDLHLFRSHNMVAQVGCRPALLAALRTLKGRPFCFAKTATFSAAVSYLQLSQQLRAAGFKPQAPVIGKRKDHPHGWSFLLLASVTDLDALFLYGYITP